MAEVGKLLSARVAAGTLGWVNRRGLEPIVRVQRPDGRCSARCQPTLCGVRVPQRLRDEAPGTIWVLRDVTARRSRAPDALSPAGGVSGRGPCTCGTHVWAPWRVPSSIPVGGRSRVASELGPSTGGRGAGFLTFSSWADRGGGRCLGPGAERWRMHEPRRDPRW